MNAIFRIACLGLLSLGAESAWSEVVVPVESVESFVNIRFSADAKSEVVGQLHQGAALQYIGTEYGWHEVALDGGGRGFISADWTVVMGDDEWQAANRQEKADDVQDVQEEGEEDPDGVTNGEPAAAASAAVDAGIAEKATEETVQGAGDVAAASEPESELPAGPAAEPAALVEAESPEPAVTETPPEAEPQPEGQSGPDAPVVAVPEVESPGEPAPVSGVASIPINFEGSVDYLVKFIAPTEGGVSQIFDNGRNVGIGTSQPQQRLEVNGNIQIHEQNSSVAGLMITQSSGDTGYIMHNRASTLTIGAGSIDRITITRDGNIGFGVNRPSHPIEMASGAHVTAGGVWTNSSSIEKKENVRALTSEEALAALTLLEPVRFNYKADDSEDYVGFIAEDVPELVATSDRSGLSAMDIVAVLTSVVQQQQKKIEELEARLDKP